MVEFLFASDMPNWITLLITLGVPTLTWLWQKRRVSHVTGLEVSLHKSTMQMNSKKYPSVEFEFANKTDKRVTVMYPNIKNSTEKFNITKGATRDIGQGTYELKFLDQCNRYSQHRVEIDIEKNDRTALPLEKIDSELLSKKPNSFFPRKYFTLEYEVLCGKRWYKVSTNY